MKSKKEQILDSATSLFAEQGFENTSVASICEKANVSKGLIYHHFASKNEILVAIFEQSTQEMMNLGGITNHKNSIEKLTKIINDVFLKLEENKLFYKLNLNIMFQPSTRKILEKQIKERATQLFTSVESVFNEIDSKNSKLLSYVFIAEIDGIALSYLSSFENYPLQQVKNQLLEKYKNDSKI